MAKRSSSRIYAAYRGCRAETGSNVWNTALLIGWDEPGGTYDHVPPPAVPSPDAASSPGELGFAFDRSGYRVPAIIVSPWVAEGTVFNEEYRHTSLIATLREQWGLGDAVHRPRRGRPDLLQRLHPRHPRDPKTWPVPKARPVPPMQQDMAALGAVLSVIGKTMLQGSANTRRNTTSRSRDSRRTPRPPSPTTKWSTSSEGSVANWFPLLASKEPVETPAH